MRRSAVQKVRPVVQMLAGPVICWCSPVYPGVKEYLTLLLAIRPKDTRVDPWARFHGKRVTLSLGTYGKTRLSSSSQAVLMQTA